MVFVSNCLVVRTEEVVLHGATCIEVEIALGGERSTLLAVYRSPSSDLGLFIDDLASYLDDRHGGRTAWLIGDVNCCILPDTKKSTVAKISRCSIWCRFFKLY